MKKKRIGRHDYIEKESDIRGKRGGGGLEANEEGVDYYFFFFFISFASTRSACLLANWNLGREKGYRLTEVPARLTAFLNPFQLICVCIYAERVIGVEI